jgi:hypothetical protein
VKYNVYITSTGGTKKLVASVLSLAAAQGVARLMAPDMAFIENGREGINPEGCG